MNIQAVMKTKKVWAVKAETDPLAAFSANRKHTMALIVSA